MAIIMSYLDCEFVIGPVSFTPSRLGCADQSLRINQIYCFGLGSQLGYEILLRQGGGLRRRGREGFVLNKLGFSEIF